VKVEPEKKALLLAPLADEYGPTQAQAERLFAKLQTSLGQGLDGTPSSARPSTASVGRASAAWEGKSILLVGLSCMALAITAAITLREPPPASAPTTIALPSTAPREIDAPREGEGAPAVPSISVHALPTAAAVQRTEKAATKVAASTSASELTPSSSDTLEREARLLADARHALKNGDGAGALALLDEHARAFPRGWLANERAAERVVVLCSLGRRADAVREATAFLEGRTKGALTRRVEMSCAGEPAPEAGE